jgi:hypothetical protein
MVKFKFKIVRNKIKQKIKHKRKRKGKKAYLGFGTCFRPTRKTPPGRPTSRVTSFGSLSGGSLGAALSSSSINHLCMARHSLRIRRDLVKGYPFAWTLPWLRSIKRKLNLLHPCGPPRLLATLTQTHAITVSVERGTVGRIHHHRLHPHAADVVRVPWPGASPSLHEGARGHLVA